MYMAGLKHLDSCRVVGCIFHNRLLNDIKQICYNNRFKNDLKNRHIKECYYSVEYYLSEEFYNIGYADVKNKLYI
jgi:hypothetical protein